MGESEAVGIEPVRAGSADGVGRSGPDGTNEFPLSPLQERILLHGLLEDRSRAYHLQLRVGLEGPLDAGALREAWARVVQRHSVLRTGFRWKGVDVPRQFVRDGVPLEWHEEDLRGAAGNTPETRFRRFLRRDFRRRFDLSAARPFRVSLLRTGDRRWQLVCTAHHLVLDGWSSRVVLGEVAALYRGLLDGALPDFPPAGSYREYIEFLGRRDRWTDAVFWRSHLEGWPGPARLDIDRGPGAESGRTGREGIRLSRVLSRELDAVARSRRIAVSSILQGAWALIVSRYAGQEDVAFGVTIPARPRGLARVDRRVGLYLNTLPVRVQVDPKLRAGAWLDALHLAQTGLREHEHAPLAELIGWGGIPSESDLFDSHLEFQDVPFDAPLAALHPELRVGPIRTRDWTHHPLSVSTTPGRRIAVAARHDTGRFDGCGVKGLLHRYRDVLHDLVFRQDDRLAEFEAWSLNPRRRSPHGPRRVDGNAPEPGLPPTRDQPGPDADPPGRNRAPIYARVFEWARRTPGAPAVVAPDGLLDYSALATRTERLASRLESSGVRTGSRIGVCTSRSSDHVVGMLGVLRAGGAYVPVDPAEPEERLAAILDDIGVRILLTRQGDLAARVRDQLSARGISFLRLDSDLSGPDPGPAGRPRVRPEDPACIVHNSPSGERPKGVAVSHGALAAVVGSALDLYELGPEDRVLPFHSTAFDAGAETIFCTLAAGGTVVLRPEAMLGRPESFWGECRRWTVTVVSLPTAFWHELVGAASRGTVPPESIRLVVVGGDRVLQDPLERWLAHTDARIRTVNAYRPSQGIGTATAWDAPRPPPTEFSDVPIGTPLPHVRAYVLNASGTQVPNGMVGELWLGGEGVAEAYATDPRANETRFRQDPFVDEAGARMYRTGDLVRWGSSGVLHLVDRTSHEASPRTRSGTIDRRARIRTGACVPPGKRGHGILHPVDAS